MDYQLSEHQKEIQKLARDFAQKEIAPVVMKYDESQEFPHEIVEKLAEMGFLGIIFPEEYGGANFSTIEYALIIEEISKVDPSVGLIIASHNGLCTNHIYSFANDEQKNKYLPDLVTGKKYGAWGLTENVSGSDAVAMQSFAERKGDRYILNGSKMFITQGTVAGTYVITAVTEKTNGKNKISAFILEPGTKGFRIGKKENKLGMRASDTAELIFENAEIPAENLIGKEHEGFKQVMKILDGGRIAIAALALGVAQGALDASIKYSKQRKQFGKFLSDFQATQFKIAEIATEIDAARLLVMKAASMKDAGEVYSKESSMAKLFASEAAVRATNEAVQIHGGYGFIKEFPVEKLYRDVKLLTIGEGTSEVQRMIIARNLINLF